MGSIGLANYLIRMVTYLLIKNFSLTVISLLLQNILPLYLVLSLMVSLCYFRASPEVPLPDPADTYVGKICFKSTLKKKK